MAKSQKHKTILVFGTFDLLHQGHRSFLKQAKQLGDKLIVVVSRDSVVTKLKRRRPIQHELERLVAVSKLLYVDAAVLASRNPRFRFDFIKKLSPDIIALGYDQTHYANNLESELKKRRIRCRVVRLSSYQPRRFKTSLLRQRLAQKKKT